MGTPGFAAGVLEKLITEKYKVVAVITAPDKPAGRGKKLNESEVKQLAEKNNIPVLQPEKLRSSDFLDELKNLKPDLGIVVAFRMLPAVVWQLPPMGTFNLHASLLPQYRGAAPINRAIMNGEKKTGITTFFLQQEIDAGNIIFREEMEIAPDETAGQLHDRMMHSGSELVVRTINAITNGNAPREKQIVPQNSKLNEAPKIFRNDCRIDWTATGKKIHDHVRGLSPYPGAWTTFETKDAELMEMKILRTKFIPGELRSDFPHVKTADGNILIEELQVAGKKRMSAAEFMNGYAVNEIRFI